MTALSTARAAATPSVQEHVSNRNAARFTGALFIIATVAALVAAALAPAVTGADYLTNLAADSNQVAVAAVFYLLAAFASAGIAVSLYPVLKSTNPAMAIGSVVFRTLEACLYVVAVLGLLSLETIGRDRASMQAVGDTLVSLRDHATLAGVLAFSLGAFLYYYAFFRSRQLPRWLSGWGIIAVILMAAACVLALFSHNPVTGYALLILPIALQEMVLAVWLMVKGFSPVALPPSVDGAD